MDISELPDFSTLREIGKTLWGEGDVRGAAVMVGAGFSRFANLPAQDSTLPPLWPDFSVAIGRELYGSKDAAIGKNPLRLAEEYRAARGSSGLDALVRSLVADDQWTPSEMHESLLKLPWSDVLTTNWDTLLERTTNCESDRHYELVLTANDIARTRAPRIVKLHGTFPSLSPFVFTEEDYRRYPHENAPFVNLAQQVLLENELCLLGFSGDDPNFLAWSGWVRDHLGSSSRKIHLIGLLDLPAPQRQLLEQRNISIVDLSPLVVSTDKENKHKVATEAVLRYFQDSKPTPKWEWERAEKREGKEVNLEDLAADWKADRNRYPGWVAAPYFERYRLRQDTAEYVRNIVIAIEENDLSEAFKVDLAIELLWRMETGHLPLEPELVDALQSLLDLPSETLSRREAFSIRTSLLTYFRQQRDADAFNACAEVMIGLAASNDERALIAYEKCLRAQRTFDYKAMTDEMPKIEGDDPIWAIRRARIATHLGDEVSAVSNLKIGYSELKSRRMRDSSSIWVLSRLAVAELLLQQFWFEDPDKTVSFSREWPQIYSSAKCDPWDELRSIESDVNRDLQREDDQSLRKRPLFDPGFSRSQTRGQTYTANYVIKAYQDLDRYSELTGLHEPPNVGLYNWLLIKASRLLDPDNRLSIWTYLSAIKSHQGLIDEHFSRLAIAKLDIELAREMVEQLRLAIDFGRFRLWRTNPEEPDNDRSTIWVERVRWQIELLSRLTVRLSSEENVNLCKWAFEIASHKGYNHWWLFEPLGHLFDRTLSSMSIELRLQFVGQAIELALPGEREIEGMARYWPELAETFLPYAEEIVREPSEWKPRISQLTEALRSRLPEEQSRAAVRLLLLLRADILNAEEKDAIHTAVKAVMEEAKGFPQNPYLLDSAWLEIAGAEAQYASTKFSEGVIADLKSNVLTTSNLRSANNVFWARYTGVPISLSSEDTRSIATILTGWRRSKQKSKFGFDSSESAIALEGAKLLSKTILPSLKIDEFDKVLASSVIEACTDGYPHLVMALPEVVSRFSDTRDKAIEQIRRSVLDRNRDVVTAGLWSIRLWAEIDEDTFPPILASDVGSLCVTRHDQSLDQAVNLAYRLMGKKLFTSEDIERLEHALDLLSLDTDYTNQSENRPSTVTITLVRKECVRLASALLSVRPDSKIAERWVRQAPDDPLPEVRMALEDNPADD